jgi:hypothetical protein
MSSLTQTLVEKDLERRRINVTWKQAAEAAAAEDSMSDSDDSGSWPPGICKNDAKPASSGAYHDSGPQRSAAKVRPAHNV